MIWKILAIGMAALVTFVAMLILVSVLPETMAIVVGSLVGGICLVAALYFIDWRNGKDRENEEKNMWN